MDQSECPCDHTRRFDLGRGLVTQPGGLRRRPARPSAFDDRRSPTHAGVIRSRCDAATRAGRVVADKRYKTFVSGACSPACVRAASNHPADCITHSHQCYAYFGQLLTCLFIRSKTRICAAEMAVRYAALRACRKVHLCHCNSLGGAT